MSAYYEIVVTSYRTGDIDRPYVNVFTYSTTELTSTSLGATALAAEFAGQMFLSGTAWLDVVTTDTIIDAVLVKSPSNPSVLSILPINLPGLTSTPSDSPFVVSELYSARKIGGIRPGFKRFGLVSDVNVSGGVAVPGYISAMGQLADACSLDLSSTVAGATVLFQPVIVRRDKYTAPSGRPAYRLPTTLTPTNHYVADNWVYRRITTQNSRKR